MNRPLSIFLLTLPVALWYWPFMIATIIMALDVRARFMDYRRLTGVPWDEAQARYLGRSWCGRGVCEAVWPEAGQFYKAKGYRWWHILPDGAPWVFFNPRFWKSVVGA